MFTETSNTVRKPLPSRGFLNHRKALGHGAHAYSGPVWLADGTELLLTATGHDGTDETPGYFDVTLCVPTDWSVKSTFTVGSLRGSKQHIKADWKGRALNLLFYASRSGQIFVTVLDDAGREPRHVC